MNVLLGLGCKTKDFCKFIMLDVALWIMGVAMLEIKFLKNRVNIWAHATNEQLAKVDWMVVQLSKGACYCNKA